jgi:hypothetical protein
VDSESERKSPTKMPILGKPHFLLTLSFHLLPSSSYICLSIKQNLSPLQLSKKKRPLKWICLSILQEEPRDSAGLLWHDGRETVWGPTDHEHNPLLRQSVDIPRGKWKGETTTTTTTRERFQQGRLGCGLNAIILLRTGRHKRKSE